ncbi:ABC transporter permease [Ferrimonas lipolytica]|uniref:FtsX-like permease family protein n=1 Tax=Ferrimonas lipolytica TaxID=2724191 RepID=A0A6H1U9Y6_9GAMM|nr:FtsX-like permease family protein [Ferrimonas lipolytica]QIZ75844.1 FtsX-like permease family protein [Ferrimonas lipolytica]
MNHRTLAWRLFRRELMRGQLRLIVAALVLAVLSVTSLALVSERLQQGLSSEASKFLAADRVLRSPSKIDEAIIIKAASADLQVAQVLEFQSMLFVGEQLQLVSVKAVTENYPLKGSVEALTTLPSKLPQRGEVWFDSRLNQLLQGQGSLAELGDANFDVSASFARLPDGGFNVFASAPTVLMNLSDVEQTGVIQPGSRLTWQYQFSGGEAELETFSEWVKPQLTTSQRWVDVKSQDSPLSRALERAEQFMLLATLLGIALACTAVGVAARRYCQRHYDAVAMFKTLGASHRQIREIFALHLGLTTAVGIVIGLVLGYASAFLMMTLLPQELQLGGFTPSLRPLYLGIATGVIAAAGFTLYPMLRLLSVPPMRVLRKDVGPIGLAGWLNGLAAVLALAALAYIYSGNFTLTWVLLLGVAVLALVLAILGFAMLSWGRQLGVRTGSSLQLALAGLRRRAGDNIVQLVGFSVALMLLLTVLALRQDLLQDWQQQLPEGTPDHFLINIADYQRDEMQQFLNDNHVKATDLYPVIRGRLGSINGETVRRSVTKEDEPEQAPRGIGRELNLTFRTELPPNNPLTAGQWFAADATDEVSLESSVADRLEVGLGDRLSFVIDGKEFSVTVTSLRQVNWETMQPNFFMIFPPAVLAEFVPTYIASFHHPVGQPELVGTLVRQFPTVSVIDVGTMIAQLRQVVNQVSLALAWVIAVVAAASALLLMAQTEAGMAARQQELAIMRTLGASGRLLRGAVTWEFVLLGAVAGVLATLVAELLLWLIKTQLFELVVTPHWSWWWSIPLAGALFIGTLGRLACRRLLANNCAVLLSQR